MKTRGIARAVPHAPVLTPSTDTVDRIGIGTRPTGMSMTVDRLGDKLGLAKMGTMGGNTGRPKGSQDRNPGARRTSKR